MYIAFDHQSLTSSGGATGRHSYVAPSELLRWENEFYKHPALLALGIDKVDLDDLCAPDR
jgi:hypothetical protein